METIKTQEQQRTSHLKSALQNDGRLVAQIKANQFRTIAPKAPTTGSSSAVISSQPPSNLPEASTAVCPKSILVPAQNYALMQVAGQEGTFSLVALPQTAPQSHIQKNLKLPIPRYQSMRSQRASEKASTKMPISAKVSKLSQVKGKVKTDFSVSASTETSELSSEQIAAVGAAASTEVLAPDNVVLCKGSQTEQAVKRSGDSFNNISYSTRACATAPVAPVNTNAQTDCNPTGSAITVLSPTIFSKTVQIIPSPPKGKLPILPYAKMKNSLLQTTRHASTQSLVKVLSVPAKNEPQSTDIKNMIPACRTRIANVAHYKKPTSKRPGRKRKSMEDLLYFEAKRKRSLSFFSRRVPEKQSPAPQPSSSPDKVMDISKKYRSIRPKPVLVMETTVPQLVPIPSLSSLSNSKDQKLVMRQVISGKPPVPSGLVSISGPGQQFTDNSGNCERFTYVGSRALHRCTTCSRCFQFKHHLKSHMNSHNNQRPYGCPVCRKAYAHSGSLSTHMKLHHSEGKPKKSLRCEFCEKVFGYVGVYFSHLREVHRVILTVEPSVRQHEENTPIDGCVDSEDQTSEQPVDPVELQIKCGRCQAITPTFADMKLHLLYVHGEEVQEGTMHEGREAENELVKHAAHYWRQLNERRSLVHCGSCDEDFFSFSKLKRHPHAQLQEVELELKKEKEEEDNSEMTVKGVTFKTGSCFNCILCSKILNSKDELLKHWREVHKCENPVALWEVLNSKLRSSVAGSTRNLVSAIEISAKDDQSHKIKAHPSNRKMTCERSKTD